MMMVASGAFFDLLGLVVVVTMIGYIAGRIDRGDTRLPQLRLPQ
jgi:hypothetical protein